MVHVTTVIAYFIFCFCSTVQAFVSEQANVVIVHLQRPTSTTQYGRPQHAWNRNNHQNVGSSSTLYTTGGWGIGPQRELTPEEFATGGQLQNKKYFEGYQIRNRGEFMRQVAMDKEEMIRGELDELLGVAKSAGLKVKDPKERLNKFDPSIIDDDNDEDESLDLAVRWEEDDDDDDENNNAANRVRPISEVDESVSITRLDEDTGSLGVW